MGVIQNNFQELLSTMLYPYTVHIYMETTDIKQWGYPRECARTVILNVVPIRCPPIYGNNKHETRGLSKRRSKGFLWFELNDNSEKVFIETRWRQPKSDKSK